MKTLLAKRRDPSRLPMIEPLEGRAMPSGTTAGAPLAPVVQHPTSAPNDPLYNGGGQWGLNGAYGINAQGAWNVTTGSPATVTIAEIDSGIDYDHPDLAQNIWINQAEIPTSRMKNLVDVYHDGYISWRDLNNAMNQGPGKITDVNGDGTIDAGDILAPMVLNPDGTDSGRGGWANPNNVQDGDSAHPDDLIGWNFVANNNNPLDDLGHGTQVAGVIAAAGNNGVGVTGVDWSAQIMALEVVDAYGNALPSAATAAIQYAARHGARVINASLGSYGGSQAESLAIAAAAQSGVVFVAGAGNDGMNTDTTPFYPAAFDLPNEISVAATDPNGQLAGSNYGPNTIDLAAPGQNIETTLQGGSYGQISGTSASAAFVAGTAALVAGLHPTWSAPLIVHQIEATATPDPALVGKLITPGIVNAGAAVGPVVPLTPTIAWATPADLVFGTPLGATQLDATATAFGSPLPGQFTYTPAMGSVLNAGADQTLSVTFYPTDSTDYAQATATVQINVGKATPQLSWANPAELVYGTALGGTQLDATATYQGSPVAGQFTYAQPSGTILHAGSGQVLTATFAPTDSADFNAATVTATINIRKATPTLGWPPPAAISYGTPLGPAQLDATASVPGSFTYTPAQGTVLAAGSQVLSATFTPLDAQDYNGGVTSTTLPVAKAHLTALAGNQSDHYGDKVPALTYTLSGFVNGDTPQAIAGAPAIATTATPTSPAGTYPIAIGPGTLSASNYDFPTFVNGTLTINKAHLTVTADSKTMLKGKAMPTLTTTITGFVAGDTMAVVSGKPTMSTTAAANCPIGVYPIAIGPGTLSAANYDFANMVGGNLSVVAPIAAAAADFNGDGRTDLAVFRPSTAQWIMSYSGGGGAVVQCGDATQGDLPVPGHYEGGSKTDLAVFRPGSDLWIIRLSTGATQMIQFGDSTQGDVPVPGDYEGIGKTDLAVFRPSTAQWIIRLSTGATKVVQFGDPKQGDMPVPGDYDGDGRADLAVFRPGNDLWIVNNSSTGATRTFQFGDVTQHDMPAPGDYDGDGRADLAVFRPGNDLWIIRYSGGGSLTTQFGDPTHGDVAVGAPLGMLSKKSPAVRPAVALTASVPTPAGPLVAIAPMTAADTAANPFAKKNSP